MNERIRELAEQSRWQEIVIEDGEEWIHAHFDEQKFAELIVQECCNWINGTLSSDEGMILLTKSFIIANIKGHFGVEE